MSNNKSVENIFGVDIFEWESWDEVDINFLQFYNITFSFESMKQFNGCDCSMKSNGFIEVTKAIEEERTGNFTPSKIVWSGYAIQIPEYKNALLEKF